MRPSAALAAAAPAAKLSAKQERGAKLLIDAKKLKKTGQKRATNHFSA